VAKEFGVPLMVDDAHGLGVMGTRGVGTAEHFGLLGTIDIEVGTGSTALGGVGGFLAGPRAVVDYLRHFSRGFLFTTSLPAATAAGLLEALRIIRDQPEVRVKLWENIHLLRRGLAELGYDVSTMEAAVVCLRVGHEEVTYQAVKALQDKGIYVNSFVRPAVKRGKSIIRLSVTAAHSVDDIHRTLEAFKDIKPAVDRERPISQE
jgi:7-keto-8-aminopelargonate synthetase-like enzyme